MGLDIQLGLGESAIVGCSHRSLGVWVAATVLLVPLASCANSGVGEALQNSLAADSKLEETAPNGQLTAIAGNPASPQVELPPDFPEALPSYPNATLQAVNQPEPATTAPGEVAGANPTSTPSPEPAETTTTWQTPDGSDRVVQFYREQLPQQGWQIQGNSLADPQGTIVAQLNDLQVTIRVPPAATAPDQPAPAGTQFAIAYTSPTSTASPTPAASPTSTASPTPSASVSPSPTPSASPQPPQQIEAFLGAEGASDLAGTPPTGAIASPPNAPVPTLPPNAYTDLAQAPTELQRYVKELAQLGVLSLAPNNAKAQASTTFEPNKPVSRREYARWLFAANNRLYADQPGQQIRPGTTTAPVAFRDIPPSDPDYAAIQGLAEAGIIPSVLSGNPTAIAFRPDAQLSREDLLLWKVPMDTRQPLPAANLTAIQQAWSFQDAAKIAPQSQRAVLADYQNGDLANIRRVFGYTTLFQPKRPVTRAEAAASLWYFGYQSTGVNAGQAKAGGTPVGP